MAVVTSMCVKTVGSLLAKKGAATARVLLSLKQKTL